MWDSFRDIDLTGWFRDQRVIGVALAPGPEPAANVAGLINHRIRQALAERIPSAIGLTLRVRVVRLRPPLAG